MQQCAAMFAQLRTTVGVCFCAMAFVAVTVLALQVGTATVARERAGSTADLGALAGASTVLGGAEAACAAASVVVAANGGRMRSCTLQGADLRITTWCTIGALSKSAQTRCQASVCD